MAEINANFVVESVQLGVTSETNNIVVDAEPINLNVFTLGFTAAGGNNGELQFNNNGGLGGAPNTAVSNGNVIFQNVSNIKIAGGTNDFFLQTDGTGNLTWAPGTANVTGIGTAAGANTQIQYTDGAGNFLASAGFTFDNSTNTFTTPGNAIISGGANVTANVNAGNVNAGNANVTGQLISTVSTGTPPLVVYSSSVVANLRAALANVANTVYDPAQPNITSVGTLTGLDVNGNITAPNFIANTGIFTGNGSGLSNINGANVNLVANANYAAFAGVANTVNDNAQPNITSLGILSDLRVNSQNVHIGTNAGNVNQSATGIGIGFNAGNTNQGNFAIAIGFEAGLANQQANSIAIGVNTNGGNNSVAIGPDVVAIGNNSVAIGNASGADISAVSIGDNAQSTINSIGIGKGSKAISNNTIVLNATGANLQSNIANSLIIKPIRNANSGNILYYDQSTGEVCYDAGGTTPTAIVNGTSNVSIPVANGNVRIGVNGTNNVVVVSSNTVNITGNLITGNANLGTLATATYFQGDGSNLTTVNASAVFGMVASANLARYVSENVQPNIRGLGTQYNLLSFDFLGTANTNLANAINLNYRNLRNGYVVEGNFVNANTFQGDVANLGAINITANGDITLSGAGSNVQGANILSANYIAGTLTTAAQPNITSVGNLTSLTITGNLISGNANAGNLVIASYIQLTPRTVASLPTAANAGSGTKAIVNNSTTTTFNAIVGNGGGNTVPIFSDGTNWRVG
jgi:hypothetical protein